MTPLTPSRAVFDHASVFMTSFLCSVAVDKTLQRFKSVSDFAPWIAIASTTFYVLRSRVSPFAPIAGAGLYLFFRYFFPPTASTSAPSEHTARTISLSAEEILKKRQEKVVETLFPNPDNLAFNASILMVSSDTQTMILLRSTSEQIQVPPSVSGHSGSLVLATAQYSVVCPRSAFKDLKKKGTAVLKITMAPTTNTGIRGTMRKIIQDRSSREHIDDLLVEKPNPESDPFWIELDGSVHLRPIMLSTESDSSGPAYSPHEESLIKKQEQVVAALFPNPTSNEPNASILMVSSDTQTMILLRNTTRPIMASRCFSGLSGPFDLVMAEYQIVCTAPISHALTAQGAKAAVVKVTLAFGVQIEIPGSLTKIITGESAQEHIDDLLIQKPTPESDSICIVIDPENETLIQRTARNKESLEKLNKEHQETQHKWQIEYQGQDEWLTNLHMVERAESAIFSIQNPEKTAVARIEYRVQVYDEASKRHLLKKALQDQLYQIQQALLCVNWASSKLFVTQIRALIQFSLAHLKAKAGLLEQAPLKEMVSKKAEEFQQENRAPLQLRTDLQWLAATHLEIDRHLPAANIPDLTPLPIVNGLRLALLAHSNERIALRNPAPLRAGQSELSDRAGERLLDAPRSLTVEESPPLQGGVLQFLALRRIDSTVSTLKKSLEKNSPVVLVQRVVQGGKIIYYAAPIDDDRRTPFGNLSTDYISLA